MITCTHYMCVVIMYVYNVCNRCDYTRTLTPRTSQRPTLGELLPKKELDPAARNSIRQNPSTDELAKLLCGDMCVSSAISSARSGHYTLQFAVLSFSPFYFRSLAIQALFPLQLC